MSEQRPAAGASRGPVVALQPPLIPFLVVQYPHKVSQLPLSHGSTVLLRTPHATEARMQSSGETIWRSSELDFPRAVWRGDAVAERHADLEDGLFENTGLELVDVNTGLLKRFIPKRELSPVGVTGGQLICTGITEDHRSCLGALEFESGEFAWEWRGAGEQPRADLVTVTAGGIYVGLSDGSLLALAAGTGREEWHHAVADLSWRLLSERAGTLKRPPTDAGETIICDVRANSVVALAKTTGERVWVWRSSGPLWEGFLSGGHYNVLTEGCLVALSASDGEVVEELDLRSSLPRPLQGVQLTSPLFVSRTHAFTGSREGYVFAFDLQRGELAWSHRPDRAGATAHDCSRFQVSDAHMYYSDLSYRVYGLRETGPASA